MLMAINAIMMNLETLRTQYRDQILALAAANKASNVRVFGSVARGDGREDSDTAIMQEAVAL